MKNFLTLLIVPMLWNCTEDKKSQNLLSETLLNVAYGNDAHQKIDIYLPAGRSESATNVLFLVHGGGWSGGSKEDFAGLIPQFRTEFPDYAIVNINYRLGTADSPGYPKQINDIQTVISHIRSGGYAVSDNYAFLGTSAGAHLSMLYGYKFDTAHQVKAVVSIVGPTDFTDPAYTGNILFENGLVNLVGNVSYQENPGLFVEVSPAAHVNAQSPPTIQFLGSADPLIPMSQGTRLETKLNDANVANDIKIYNAGHGNFNPVDAAEINQLIKEFLNQHM